MYCHLERCLELSGPFFFFLLDVIDLTVDDKDDLQRAIALSLEESNRTFRETGITDEEQAISRYGNGSLLCYLFSPVLSDKITNASRILSLFVLINPCSPASVIPPPPITLLSHIQFALLAWPPCWPVPHTGGPVVRPYPWPCPLVCLNSWPF